MAASESSDAKELTRKLFWAVSSTFPGLTKQEKAKTFSWAADLAERMIDRRPPSLSLPVDFGQKNGYHGQAVGRGGGKNRPSIQRSIPPPPPSDQPAWDRQQAGMRRKAWAYVLQGRAASRQLPIPKEAYREVGYGSSDSLS